MAYPIEAKEKQHLVALKNRLVDTHFILISSSGSSRSDAAAAAATAAAAAALPASDIP